MIYKERIRACISYMGKDAGKNIVESPSIPT